MKIAMLIDAWHPLWGGGQKVAYEISKRLSENYHFKIDLFVMNIVNSKEPKIKKVNDNFRIIAVGKKRRWSFINRLLWCFLVIFEILKFNKKRRYELIYAHANLAGLPGKILSIILRIPIVYHVHGSGIEAIKEMYGKNLKSLFLYFFETFLQRFIKYDLEISVDRRFMKLKNRNKVVYVPNGVNVKEFDKVKVNKEKKFFKILFVGRLHPQKGLKYLLYALNSIKKSLNNVEVHLIGTGKQEKELKELSSKLGLTNIIKFRGPMFGDNLIKEYKSSHLFVLPSLFEGQPLTLLEAWAAKLPVIVTDVGDNRYFVKNNKNGWIIQPKNIKKLAETLLKAINDSKLRDKGLNGYKLVKNNYTWDRIVKRIYELYR